MADKTSVLKAAILERDVAIFGLVESLEEILNLCAIGDVDESTEAHGWGGAIQRARAAIAAATGGSHG